MTHGLVLVRRGRRYLMRQNGQGEWWEGLWDFPRIELTAPTHTSSAETFSASERKRSAAGAGAESDRLAEQVTSRLSELFGLECRLGGRLKILTHGVTRFRIRVHCFQAQLCPGTQIRRLPGNWRWVADCAEEAVPMTSTAKRLCSSLKSNAS